MKYARICVVVFALAIAVSSNAGASPLGLFQNPTPEFPFALDPLRDGALVGGGLVLYGSSLYLQSIKPAPNPSDINPVNIPFFDRAYPSNPSTTLTTLGDDISIALAALPLVLLPGRTGGEILTLGVMYGETLELAYSVDSLLKSAIVRYRPYAYSTTTLADFSNVRITESFPSANSSLAFAAAVFSGYAFDELYPDSSLRFWVWASGLGAATAVSGLLVAGGDHFVSDVVAGAVIGAASGFLVPLFHEHFRPITMKPGDAVSSIEINPGVGGIAVRLCLRP
jgi:undecaprenyl-diphosphatase